MFKKYDAYKDSGVEWLGKIPSNWDIFSLKRSIDGCFNGLWGSDPKENNDDIVVLRVADFDRNKLVIDNSKLTLRNIKKSEIGNRLLKKGDLLIEKSGGGDKTLVGCVVLFNENYKALTSNFVAKMTPKSNVNSYFLNYFFAALYANNINYQSIKQTTGIQNLDTNSYLNEKLALPSLHEQEAIVSFLNQKTSEIDQAIAIKEQQIALLNERKQIVIQKAVTQGLNPNVAMKDSGVEWIGQIPEDWNIDRLGTILEPISKKGYADKQLLSITREKGVIVRDVEDDSENHNFIPDDLSNYKLIEEGQFGMNKMKAWQGSYGVSAYTGIVSPAYYIFRFIKPIHPEFFHWAIRCKLYVSFFGSASDGVRIGQWDLSKDRMKHIPFVFPSLEQQKIIADYLTQQTELISEEINQYSAQIEKLKEYKTTLINDAVTGKIKVA